MTELFFDNRILKDFEFLSKDQFFEIVNFLNQLTNRCQLSEWKRKQLIEEVHQASYLFRKRKNLLYNFFTFQTDDVSELYFDE